MIIVLIDISMWDKETTLKDWHIKYHGLNKNDVSIPIH